jgi:hypothetical protein
VHFYQEAIEAGEGGAAEERLRAQIRVFLRRILGQAQWPCPSDLAAPG